MPPFANICSKNVCSIVSARADKSQEGGTHEGGGRRAENADCEFKGIGCFVAWLEESGDASLYMETLADGGECHMYPLG